jgi:hypothetical protein
MNQPLVKRSLAELDTVIEEIVQRNPEWYKEIIQLIEESKNDHNERMDGIG